MEKTEKEKAVIELEKWATENHGSALWLAAGLMYRGGADPRAVLEYIKSKETKNDD